MAAAVSGQETCVVLGPVQANFLITFGRSVELPTAPKLRLSQIAGTSRLGIAP